MAENNLARSRNDMPDVFADGDPLAELARIVGYEERVVSKPDLPVAPVSMAARREPAFNLEDELLREFERYDAPSPRLDPVDDLAGLEPEPVLAEPVEMRFASPVEPAFTDLPAYEAQPLASVDEPELTYEPELSYEAAEMPSDVSSDEAPADSSIWPEQYAAVAASDMPADAAISQSDSHVADDAETIGQPSAVEPTEERFGFDLAGELESSIDPAPVVAPVTASSMSRKPGFTPSFRMPLANFQSAAGVAHLKRTEPNVTMVPPVAAQVVSPDVVVAESRPEVAQPAMPHFAPMAIPVAGPSEPVAAKPQEARDRFSDLDELLYDVDRYSTGSQSVQPVSSQPVAPALPVAPAPATSVAALSTSVSAGSVASSLAPAVEDPFADMEFELALDDLELDLADMVGAENARKVEPVHEFIQPIPVVAPAASIPVAVPPAPAPAPVAQVAAPVSAPSGYATHSYAGVAASAPAAATALASQPGPARPPIASADVEDDVPFDPSLIAESEEQPETIAELDVPALPIEDEQEPPLYRNDFDLDIDAELASLLETPESVASLHAEKANAQPVTSIPGSQAASSQSVYAELDDFERALEEDFRRSLATPLQPDERYAPVENYDDAEEAGRGTSVRRWIAPLAAIGVIAVFGAGAYAWLGGSVGGAAGNGEPVVIAADTDPVKVAPENPGGKTVPNQDKAVYDRVAGGMSEEPKQQQLISSSEEPVDVVQKTLMPENFALEGEDDMQMTDVGETDDPRLLPQDQQAAAQPADQQAVAVMPRKVKTMIVRADGKLVEQEIEQPAPAASTEKIAAAPARGDSPEMAGQTAAPFPTVGGSPASVAQSAAVTPAAVSASEALPPVGGSETVSAMPVAAQTPAAIEQLAEPAQTAAVRAPVPAMRPAQQPVNVVASVSDQGNVRPVAATPAAAASAQQSAAPANQVASLGEGGYVIQIASLPSQADAQRSYQNLSNKFGSVIGGRGVDIKAAEIAGKGTFYRVRIPAGSKSDAVALCERYRSAGGSCLVAR